MVRGMERDRKRSLEGAEHHAVPGIVFVDDGVVGPRSTQLPGGGTRGDLQVPLARRAPQHEQLARLRAVEKRTIRHVGTAWELGRVLLPKVARAEKRHRLPRRACQVRRQLHRIHCAVAHLRPFVAEHHVGLAVLLEERAVERRPVARRDRPVAPHLERAFRTVCLEDVG